MGSTELGIHISLDDCETVYSSFSYLKKLPIESLKIDKSFIDDIVNNLQSRKLLKSLLNIAHDLNMKTIKNSINKTFYKFPLITYNFSIL
jgi:EAL domain-containing protein (putative c-di-GMP-specific phosphodiesterase class I)